MKYPIFFFILGFFVSLGKLASPVCQSETLDPQKIILARDEAFLLGRISPIAIGEITKINTAPKGRWVLFIERKSELVGEKKLWLYDTQRHKSTLLYRVPDNSGKDDHAGQDHLMQDQIVWFPGTKKAVVCFATVNDVHHTVLEPIIRTFVHIDAEAGKARLITTPSPFIRTIRPILGMNMLIMSGIIDSDRKNQPICFLYPSGSFTSLGEVPNRSFPVDYLTQDLNNFVFGIRESNDKAAWYTVRLRDAQVTYSPQKPLNLVLGKDLISDVILSLKQTVDEVEVTGTEGRQTSSNAIWIEATVPRSDKLHTRALVTLGADGEGVLLHDLSAFLFQKDGVLYSVSITKVDPVIVEKRFPLKK